MRDRHRQNRRERRAARDRYNAERRQRRRGRPLNGPPLLLAVMGLNLAIFVVGIVLGLAVPMVLYILSILFGRPLRAAARATQEAGGQARNAMRDARSYLLHGPAAAGTGADGVRVEEEPGPRVRVAPEDVVETTATEVVEPTESERVHRR
jgi:hypothetical protein